MKPYEAKELVKDVFESSFDKGKFKLFIKNLLKDFEEKTFIYKGNTIPRAYENYIRKFERLGKFEDKEGNVIDILIVELKRDHSVEYARSTQRNFIRWYLTGSRGGQMKDAALVAFHSEKSSDWRFSFIKMQYSLETKKDELTPAKRYSFLVGEKGKSHTAQQQLVKLLKKDAPPLMSDIEEAFNIETVTNEFFEKYKLLVFDLVDAIEEILENDSIVKNEFESKSIQVIDFAKKLMGQIVFIYFLQRKGWLGLQNGQKYGEGDRNFLRSLYNLKSDNENFFNDYLEYLFYDALSQKRVTDFYPRFNCRIPFLNGGLFDPINFYDWQKTDIVIPDELFTNTNKTKEGDIGDGILDVFDRYNFTVKEDEPLDKEVAVDPEMLGKVFERMLDVKERKSKGAFYTPREIVHYMSQESLIHYLDSAINSQPKAYQKLGEDQTDIFGNKAATQTSLEVPVTNERVPKEDIEKLIKQGEQLIEKDVAILKGSLKGNNKKFQIPDSIRKHAKEIDEALENIRVCDPAVGSGAFPVGVMTEIVKARSILFKIQNPDKEPSHYELKKHAIHHCLYGVDIDASAVEICKLRLWLSLVVDEQRIDVIEPLPNLDYKIVKGNSLIGMPDNVMRDLKLQQEIKELMEKYYAETDQDDKRELKHIIDNKIKQLLKSAEQYAGYPIDFDFKLFFHEVFNEKGGFDVVIGNPPYLESRNKKFNESLKITLQKVIKNRLKEYSKYISRGSDLLTYFIELSLYILNKSGLSILITQNSWLDTNYGKLFQEFLLKNYNLIAIIDSDFKYFDKKTGPNINTIISLISKSRNYEYERILFAKININFESFTTSVTNTEKLKNNNFGEIKFWDNYTASKFKWGILLNSDNFEIKIFELLNKYGKKIYEIDEKKIDIGQGLNISKDYIIDIDFVKDFNFLNKSIIPIFTNDDGATYEIKETKKYILLDDNITLSEKEKILKKSKKFFKKDSTTKIPPILVLPRGIGRHFCALNKINAYTASFVEIYDKNSILKKWEILNLWLFLNSSIFWLLRELTGRKNLGGGMLKSEATDIKEIPIYYKFKNNKKEIEKIYELSKSLPIKNTLEEIETYHHKLIDQIVFDHLGIAKKEREKILNLLRNRILNRIKKSKT